MGRPARGAVPKHDVVLEAARELFLADGYLAVSMDRIATRARVSKPTVYACFASKEAAFAAVMTLASKDLRAALEASEMLEGRPETALPAFGARLLRVLLSPSAVATHRLWATDSGRFGDQRAAWERVSMTPVHQALAKYLGQETARGTLAVREPRLAATQFLGMLKEPTLWPRVLGLRSVAFQQREVVGTACRTFLAAYARTR